LKSVLTHILLIAFMCGSVVLPGDFILCMVEHGHIAIESAGSTHCADHEDHHCDETCMALESEQERHAHLDIPLSVFSGSFHHSVSGHHGTSTLCQGIDNHGIMPHPHAPSFHESVRICSTGPPHHEVPHMNSMLRSTVIMI
jgi:hypothetical protein